MRMLQCQAALNTRLIIVPLYKFILVAMICFLLQKTFCKRFLWGAFFKRTTLISLFSPCPNKMKRNNETLSCRHFGAWLFYRNLVYPEPRALNQFARGLNMRPHFATVFLQYGYTYLCFCFVFSHRVRNWAIKWLKIIGIRWSTGKRERTKLNNYGKEKEGSNSIYAETNSDL